MAQFHDAPAHRYTGLMRDALPLYDRLQDELALATADIAVSRLLDLGAGTGETSRRCLKAHPTARIVAVDASDEMLNIAATMLGDRIELRRGRLEDPLPDGPFELVVSALAVHHLDGPGKADLFRRIRTCLAPTGLFVMADVVIPDAPVAQPTPLDPAVDLPDRLQDILDWLQQAGLRPAVHWAEQDLVVITASIDEPVRIRTYDPTWPARYEAEQEALRAAIGRWVLGGIHHVGSTAVPGLDAKPIIDILVGVADLPSSRACFEPLAELRYLYAPYLPDEMHWFCKPDPAARTHHLHLVPADSARFRDELAFRDHLRAHPAVAADYAALKHDLASRYEHDRDGYTNAKTEFVRRVLAQAGSY